MMRKFQIVLVAAFLVSAGIVQAQGEETPVMSRIVSVGLFKNGLAVVRRELNLPAAGTFVLSDVPEPIHGTWWLQSETPVDVTVSEREVDDPNFAAAALTNLENLQKSLAERTVTIFFRENQLPAVTGKVEKIESKKQEATAFADSYAIRDQYSSYNSNSPRPEVAQRFLILQTETGRSFVDVNMIAYFKVDGKETLSAAKKKSSVMIFQTARATKATISYLTRGIAWTPSYHIDTTDPKTLSIEQTAVIKNELGDLENVEIQLISGFPSVKFGHVISPLSPRTNWAAFFSNLNQRPSSSYNNDAQQISSNSGTIYQREPGNSLDISAIPTGEGVDLHYQSIGLRTLKRGEALSVSVAKAKADYERVIEWFIPNTRNEQGGAVADYARRQDQEKYEESIWDTLRFRNPFAFPMTTGVVSVVANGQFCGQQMSFWTNVGEEASVKITKSLGVRSRSTEHEDPAKRENVQLGHSNYWKSKVSSELTVNNHRKETVKIIIRRQFSGELINAEGDPKKQLLVDTVYSVNPHNELFWTLTLRPGEEKIISYSYTVLVR